MSHQDRERGVPTTLELRLRVEPSGILALETRVPDCVNHSSGNAVKSFALRQARHQKRIEKGTSSRRSPQLPWRATALGR